MALPPEYVIKLRGKNLFLGNVRWGGSYRGGWDAGDHLQPAFTSLTRAQAPQYKKECQWPLLVRLSFFFLLGPLHWSSLSPTFRKHRNIHAMSPRHFGSLFFSLPALWSPINVFGPPTIEKGGMCLKLILLPPDHKQDVWISLMPPILEALELQPIRASINSRFLFARIFKMDRSGVD